MTDQLWPMLAQLSEAQRSVRDQFQRGGSTATVLLLLVGLALLVMIARYLTRRQKLAARPAVVNDPQRLFRDMLAKLGLTTTERQHLTSLATDLAIEHPTALLLSPLLLETTEQNWRRKYGNTNLCSAGKFDSSITLAAKLFPISLANPA